MTDKCLTWPRGPWSPCTSRMRCNTAVGCQLPCANRAHTQTQARTHAGGRRQRTAGCDLGYSGAAGRRPLQVAPCLGAPQLASRQPSPRAGLEKAPEQARATLRFLPHALVLPACLPAVNLKSWGWPLKPADMCACPRCLHLGRRLAGRVSTTCLGLPDTVALLWIDDALDDQRGPHGLDMCDGTGSTSDALP